jgi:hypothetical protein
MADIDYIDDMYNRVRPVRLPEEYGKPQVDQTKILLQSANEALAPQVLAQEALKQSVSNQAEEIKKYQSPQRNDLADAIMLLGAPLLGALGGEAGALSAPKAYAGASGIYEGQIKEEREKQKLLREAANKKIEEDRKRMYELGGEISKAKLGAGKDIAQMELEKYKQEEKNKRATIMSAGQKAADTAFAKDYAEFVAGGYSQGINQLKQIDNVVEKIKQPGKLSGKIGLIPKIARDVVAPETSAVQEQVEQVVQNSIRAVFGGNPTEREGVGLMERAYNPRLPEKENIEKLQRFKNQLQMANEAKLQAAKYFQQNGTLQGFKGPTFDTISDFLNYLDIQEKQQGISPKKQTGEMTREEKIKFLQGGK